MYIIIRIFFAEPYLANDGDALKWTRNIGEARKYYTLNEASKMARGVYGARAFWYNSFTKYDNSCHTYQLAVSGNLYDD